MNAHKWEFRIQFQIQFMFFGFHMMTKKYNSNFLLGPNCASVQKIVRKIINVKIYSNSILSVS